MKLTLTIAVVLLSNACCRDAFATPTRQENAQLWLDLAADFTAVSKSTASRFLDGLIFWSDPESISAEPDSVTVEPKPSAVSAGVTFAIEADPIEATPVANGPVDLESVAITRLLAVVRVGDEVESRSLAANAEASVQDPADDEPTEGDAQEPEQPDDRFEDEVDDPLRSSRREEYDRYYAGRGEPRRFQNLFLDITSGALNEPESEATAFGSMGFNLGLPLANTGLGVQVGGDLTTIEGGDFFWDGTAGLFGRGIELDTGIHAGGAVLGDYRHTVDGSDLFSLRWVAGVSTSDGHNVGVRGAYPLNRQTVLRNTTSRAEEKVTLRHDLFYGYDFDPEITAEGWVGYQSGEVNGMVFGGTLSWALAPDLSFAPMGEINTDGDYAVGVSFVFDFGASGLASTTTHFDRRGANDYTPFRKRSFPLMLVGRERDRAAGGGPVDPGSGPSPSPRPGPQPKEFDCSTHTSSTYDQFLRRRR